MSALAAVSAIRTPQPLRDPTGTIAAYFVPPEEYEGMLAELESLRTQVARLQRQKDGYVAQLNEVYRTWIAPLPSEEELNGPVQNPNGIDAIIAKLEAR